MEVAVVHHAWRRLCVAGMLGAAAAFPAWSLAQAPERQEPGGAAPAAGPAARERGDGGGGGDRAALDAQWQSAYAAGDFAKAAQVLEQVVRLSPGDAIVRYNQACVLSRAGDIGGAEAALRRCLELGFTDFPRLRAEPDLVPLRETAVFMALEQGWGVLQDTGIDHRLKRFERTLAAGGQSAAQRGYRFERDAELRLAYVSAFSAAGFEETRQELRLMHRMWQDMVLPLDAQGRTQDAVISKGPRPDPWVIVFLPTPADFASWAASAFGTRADRIGGIYDNHALQLVARDLGPTLRHEYWHALHWRQMSRIGQVHPIWLSEGLCSLSEDVDMVMGAAQDAPPRPIPSASWRINTAKRMVTTNLLPRLAALMTMDEKTYMGGRSLGNYAASRAFFLWLVDGAGNGSNIAPFSAKGRLERSRLREWYTAYISDFASDPSGKSTTERVLGKPLADLDRDLRAWLKAVPNVGEANTPGLPGLPVLFEAVGGEGLVVARQEGLGRDLLRNPLLAGDVVTAINGHRVRDQTELARVMGGWPPGSSRFQDGQIVTLTVRRDGRPFEVKVKLGVHQ